MNQSAMFCLVTLITAGCGSNTEPGAGSPPPSAAGTQATNAGGTATTATAGKSASAGAGSTTAGAASAGTGTSAAGSGSTPAQANSAGVTASSGAAGTTAVPVTSGADAPPPVAGAPAAPTGKMRRAVSADFLNQTLSVVNLDKMVEGSKREDALIGTVDLSKYTPGPLALAITPDGKTAVVSISGGWLALVANDVPAGNGTLVFVDLDTLKVTGELYTGASPMGIAITHDGKHAYVGQLSDSYISYVDIEAKTYEKIQTGNQWNEELAIDDTGTIGALTTGTGGDMMSFSADNAGMKTGQTRGLSGDAGGVAFFAGTKIAFIIQAPTQLTGMTGGYNVIDATDPAAPMVLDSNRVMGDSRSAYPVTSVASRKSVVFPFAQDGKLSLVEMALEANKAKMVQMISVGDATFSYGLTATPEGVVLACVGSEHYVAVVDMNTQKVFTVPWGTTKTGPLDIRLIPDGAAAPQL